MDTPPSFIPPPTSIFHPSFLLLLLVGGVEKANVLLIKHTYTLRRPASFLIFFLHNFFFPYAALSFYSQTNTNTLLLPPLSLVVGLIQLHTHIHHISMQAQTKINQHTKEERRDGKASVSYLQLELVPVPL